MILVMKSEHFKYLKDNVIQLNVGKKTSFYPIAYGILGLSQLLGGGLFDPHPKKHS